MTGALVAFALGTAVAGSAGCAQRPSPEDPAALTVVSPAAVPAAPPVVVDAGPTTLLLGPRKPCATCLVLLRSGPVWNNTVNIVYAPDGDGQRYRVLGTSDNMSAMATNGEAVIWSNSHGQVMSAAPGIVDTYESADLSLVWDTSLALTLKQAFGLRSDWLMEWTRPEGVPRKIADPARGPLVVVGSNVVFLADPHQLMTVPATGGAAKKLGAPLGEDPPIIVSDGRRLYFSQPTAGSICSLAADGSELQPRVLAANETAPSAVAIDGNAIDFTAGDAVKRVSKAGGAVEILASGEDNPVAVVADEHAIYWLTSSAMLRSLRR